MKRMRFRFQRVLEIKKALEEKCKGELGKVQLELQQVQGELEALRRAQRQRVAAEAFPAGSRLDLASLQIQAQYGVRLEREIEIHLEQIERIGQAVEERRQKLAEAVRERRTFEVLKERELAQYKLARKRWEQSLLDEVGGRIHQRSEGRPEEG